MSFKLLINLLDASKGFYLQIFNHLASYSISFHCKGKGFFRKQSSCQIDFFREGGRGEGTPPTPPTEKISRISVVKHEIHQRKTKNCLHPDFLSDTVFSVVDNNTTTTQSENIWQHTLKTETFRQASSRHGTG